MASNVCKCLSPATLCVECTPLWNTALERGVREVEDLEYPEETYPILFFRKLPYTIDNSTSLCFGEALSARARAYFGELVLVHVRTLKSSAKDSNPSTGLFYLVDLPDRARENPVKEMLKIGLFNKLDIPADEWQWKVPKEDKCPSAVRLTVFETLDSVSYVDELDEAALDAVMDGGSFEAGKSGCSVM
ncbi:hypothetical protein BJX70DRAFT_395369 [Aspergillus crustosus]